MALTQTTLAGAVTATATQLTLTSYTAPSTGAIPSDKVLRVDGEWMLITNDSLHPAVSVVRGYFGTVAAAHAVLATAAYGLVTDVTQLNQVPGGNVTSYGASGAITIPTTPSNTEELIFLNKSSAAAAMTLAAPALDQDGLLLVITSNTAQAHTVTATGLYNDGSTTTDVATFAAHAGASMTIQAARGKWNVISSTGITFT